jgi:hypothetical protein
MPLLPFFTSTVLCYPKYPSGIQAGIALSFENLEFSPVKQRPAPFLLLALCIPTLCQFLLDKGVFWNDSLNWNIAELRSVSLRCAL